MRAAFAAGAVSTMILAASSPATAHTQTLTNWTGCCTVQGTGTLFDGHVLMNACDEKADGLGVRTEYHTVAGRYLSIGDANGSQPGCGAEYSRDGTGVLNIRVCVGSGTGDCTPWRHTPS